MSGRTSTIAIATVLLFICTPRIANADPMLYGQDTNFGPIMEIDPGTGQAGAVSGTYTTSNHSPSNSPSAFDPVGGRYFFYAHEDGGGPWKLWTIDVETGGITKKVVSNTYGGLHYDPITAMLYGQDTNFGPIAAIDPTTGQGTPITGTYTTSNHSPSNSPSAFDPVGGRYFFYAHEDGGGPWKLWTVDVETGGITKKAVASIVGGLYYDYYDSPLAIPGEGYHMDRDELLLLNAGGSTAFDGALASYLWDLDGDGVFETNAGSQAMLSLDYSYLEGLGLSLDTPHTISLRVTDSFGYEDFANSSLTIVPEPATMSLLALGGLVLLKRRNK